METDSGEVLRRKVEKNCENKVKSTWNCIEGTIWRMWVWQRAVHCALSDKGEENVRKKAGNGGTKLRSDTTRFQTAQSLPGKCGFQMGRWSFFWGSGWGTRNCALIMGFTQRLQPPRSACSYNMSHTLNIPSWNTDQGVHQSWEYFGGKTNNAQWK